MTARNYSNTASEAQAAVLIGAADLSAALASYSGFPDPPYIAALDPDTTDEEIVLVTNVAGSTVTMTRAYDGSTAKSHAAGAVFRHVAAAVDFQEANDHIQASTGVHGVTGAVVGTTDVQTLSGKTLNSPTISAPTITGTMTAAAAAFSGTVTLGTATVTSLTATTGHVTGTLDVDGATTLADVTAAGVTATTGAFSGAVTVGGTLGVTGALTAPSGAFTGAVSGSTGTFTTTTSDELELEQQAADLSAAVGNSSLFARTDFGLYFRPNSQNRRRVSMHWGSSATLPTTGVIEGDTVYHSGLASMMRYSGSSWRQVDVIQVANMAARPTGADLHAGFRVFSLADDDEYVYDGTYWRNPLTGGQTPTGASAGDYITGVSGTTVASLNGSGAVVITTGRTFSSAPVFALVSPGAAGGGLRTAVPENTEFTTTSIKVYCYNSAANLIAGTGSVRVSWWTVGYNN